jgi:hypothetical protein
MVCSGCAEVIPIAPMYGQAAQPNPSSRQTPIGTAQRVSPAKVKDWQKLGQGRGLRVHLSKPAWAVLVFAAAMTLIVISETRSSKLQPDQENQPESQNPAASPAESPQPHEQQVPETNTPVQTNQENPGAHEPASTTPPPNPAGPKPIQPRPHRDIGVDLALPVYSRVSLMDFTDPNGTVVKNIMANDLLVLVDRTPTTGWFDVIDVRSGKEAWVDQDDVKIQLTQHPEQAAKLTEQYVGSDDPPEVSVQNATGDTLSLKIGEKPYTLQLLRLGARCHSR